MAVFEAQWQVEDKSTNTSVLLFLRRIQNETMDLICDLTSTVTIGQT